MKLSVRLTVVATLVLTVAAIALLAQKPAKSPSTSNAKLIARGKYLVTQVGMCQDCHSPRNEKGDFVEEQWLGGSPLFMKPTVPIPNWTDQAPRIAGLPGFKDEDIIKFLTSGEPPNGIPARPPMPPYRFTREDATAVTAYLRSLGTQTASARTKEAAGGEKKE